MADHPHIKLVEETWDAVSRSDVDSLRRAWGTDTVWHVQDTSPWAGDYVGCEEIIDHLADLGDSAVDYQIRLDDIIANDRYAVILARVSARKDDASLDTGYVLLARIADSRICEVWSIPSEPTAVASFWNKSAPSHLEKPALLTA